MTDVKAQDTGKSEQGLEKDKKRKTPKETPGNIDIDENTARPEEYNTFNKNTVTPVHN